MQSKSAREKDMRWFVMFVIAVCLLFLFKWPSTKSAKYEPLFHYGVVSCNRHSPIPYGWMFLKKTAHRIHENENIGMING